MKKKERENLQNVFIEIQRKIKYKNRNKEVLIYINNTLLELEFDL